LRFPNRHSEEYKLSLTDQESDHQVNALIDCHAHAVWVNVSSDGDPNDDYECEARVKVEIHNGEIIVSVYDTVIGEDPIYQMRREVDNA
jgi:hypothetical protein